MLINERILANLINNSLSGIHLFLTLSAATTTTKRKSFIYPIKQPFTIHSNETSPNPNFIIKGNMNIKIFANSLPENYTPAKN